MSVTYGKLANRVTKILRTDYERSPLSDLTKEQVTTFIRIVFDQIAEAIGSGEDVSLDGFGRLYPDIKNPRVVKSALTNTEHVTGFRVTVRFSPYSKLKNRAAKFMRSILGVEVT